MTPEYAKAKLALNKRASILPYLIGGGIGAGILHLLNRGKSESKPIAIESSTITSKPTTISERLAKSKSILPSPSTLRQKLQTGLQNVATSQTGQFFGNLFDRYLKR